MNIFNKKCIKCNSSMKKDWQGMTHRKAAPQKRKHNREENIIGKKAQQARRHHGEEIAAGKGTPLSNRTATLAACPSPTFLPVSEARLLFTAYQSRRPKPAAPQRPLFFRHIIFMREKLLAIGRKLLLFSNACDIMTS